MSITHDDESSTNKPNADFQSSKLKHIIFVCFYHRVLYVNIRINNINIICFWLNIKKIIITFLKIN